MIADYIIFGFLKVNSCSSREATTCDWSTRYSNIDRHDTRLEANVDKLANEFNETLSLREPASAYLDKHQS